MNLFCSYNVISSFLTKFGLIIEYMKTKVFHFSKSQRVFNPLLNLTPIGGLILYPKNTWCYLRFIFDWKLLFQQYIDFYANKVILTIKYMKILGNSSKGLDPIQKRYIYRYCILLIALYGFQLWYYNKVLLAYPLKELRCHKLHSACISTTSRLIFTNQVVLESPKWELFAHMRDVQKWQQMTEISGHQ